mgnify:CR=1 FL=1
MESKAHFAEYKMKKRYDSLEESTKERERVYGPDKQQKALDQLDLISDALGDPDSEYFLKCGGLT